jgi:hypothetical protein
MLRIVEYRTLMIRSSQQLARLLAKSQTQSRGNIISVTLDETYSSGIVFQGSNV